jgi:hypothetical protein
MPSNPNSASEEAGAKSKPVSILRIAPMPGHASALRLFGLLRDRPTGDLLFVLDAIQTCDASWNSVEPSSAAGTKSPGAHDQCLSALRRATAELGRNPSRRDYDAWRSAQITQVGLPAASTIRRLVGNGSWTEALAAVVPGVRPDSGTRRLLTRGRRFSRDECRAAFGLFCAEMPAGGRSARAYRMWANRYAANPGAHRVPFDHRLLTIRLGMSWRELVELSERPSL